MKEKSCGAVVWTENERGEILYLVEHMNQGHTSLCKGHVEAGETEEQTALREISEETSLKVSIDTGFRRVITYAPYKDSPDVLKDVVFFTAKAAKPESTADRHDDEVGSSEWLPLTEALEALTHDSDKEVLEAADRYIREKKD